MKKIFIILLLAPSFLFAQKTKYISHTFTARESLSSIGRMYNINARELAKLNNISYDKGLATGQVLKVPATNAAIVNEPAAITEAFKTPAKPVVSAGQGAPVYHTVAKKETLYHISTLYNKVPIADLKKWNNLTGDGLSEGSTLIVGYGKAAAPATNAGTTTTVTTPVVQTEISKTTEVVKAKEPVKQAPVFIKDTKPAEVKHTPPAIVTGKNFNGGVFKSLYIQSSKPDETGTAGVFKSTSGWEDGKYYCLHNSASTGSIIRITNKATNKTVYAKVLDVIPDLKQNNNLVLRLSNAAAEEPGVAGEVNFDCTISF